ncbi:hypothetical protein RMCBS344292_11264 [Rhizopus microsporus]|nr:hypothetical protein RMCBS344292_11264 [Rhizopus microsporus]
MLMMAPFTTPTPPSTKGKKPYKSWLKDGVNGGPSSMDVLVNWLSKKSNYAKWKGDDCERIPKKSLLESIIDEMREVGIYHRLAKDVASKISTLQANYRLAREWREVDGKKLLESGATEEAVHEELLKRFPYWDALHEVFSSNRTSAWPMSISSITHTEKQQQQQQQQTEEDEEDLFKLDDVTLKKRRRLSDSHVETSNNTSLANSPTHSTQSLPAISHPNNNNNNLTTPPFTSNNYKFTNSPPLVIRPLPRVLPPANHYFDPQPHHYNNAPLTPQPSRDVLAESLIQVTREKEAGRMKRSQEMLQFLREKRLERDQLLLEREITKRVKAKADLVKHLIEAGFDKEAIAEQLNKL